MAVRRTKFPLPAVPAATKSREGFFTIKPIGGINNISPVRDGNLTEAYNLENIQVEDIGYRVRSGFSSLYSVSLNTAGAAPSSTSRIEYMTQAKEYLVTIAGRDLYYTNTGADSGSDPTQSTSGNSFPALNYSLSTQRYTGALVNDGDYGQSLVLTAVDQMVPQILPLDGTSSHTTHQGFVDSGNSFAYAGCGIDDRLVFFGVVDSLGTEYKTRVQWSARGSPESFTAGGFEDLVDMSGTGFAIVPQTHRAILFTERETWQAVPRRDAYAFDFSALRKDLGLIAPRAYVDTPFGLFWIANDQTMKRLLGGRISTVSRKALTFNVTGQVSLFPDTDNNYLTIETTTTGLNFDTDSSHLVLNTTGTLLAIVGTDSYLNLQTEADYTYNLFLTYNPEDKEVVVWYGELSTLAGSGSDKGFALRVDTLAPISDFLDDGVWTYYTVPKRINAATPYTTGAGKISMLYGSSSADSWPEIYKWTSERTYDEMMGANHDITGKWWTNVINDRQSRNIRLNEVTLWTEELDADAGVRAIGLSHGTSPKISDNLGSESIRTFSFGANSSAESTYQSYTFNDKAGPWNWFYAELKPNSASGKMVITHADVHYIKYSGRRKGERMPW